MDSLFVHLCSFLSRDSLPSLIPVSCHPLPAPPPPRLSVPFLFSRFFLPPPLPSFPPFFSPVSLDPSFPPCGAPSLPVFCFAPALPLPFLSFSPFLFFPLLFCLVFVVPPPLSCPRFLSPLWRPCVWPLFLTVCSYLVFLMHHGDVLRFDCIGTSRRSHVWARLMPDVASPRVWGSPLCFSETVSLFVCCPQYPSDEELISPSVLVNQPSPFLFWPEVCPTSF